jgi:hypothetical protein
MNAPSERIQVVESGPDMSHLIIRQVVQPHGCLASDAAPVRGQSLAPAHPRAADSANDPNAGPYRA